MMDVNTPEGRRFWTAESGGEENLRRKKFSDPCLGLYGLLTDRSRPCAIDCTLRQVTIWAARRINCSSLRVEVGSKRRSAAVSSNLRLVLCVIKGSEYAVQET